MPNPHRRQLPYHRRRRREGPGHLRQRAQVHPLHPRGKKRRGKIVLVVLLGPLLRDAAATPPAADPLDQPAHRRVAGPGAWGGTGGGRAARGTWACTCSGSARCSGSCASRWRSPVPGGGPVVADRPLHHPRLRPNGACPRDPFPGGGNSSRRGIFTNRPLLLAVAVTCSCNSGGVRPAAGDLRTVPLLPGTLALCAAASARALLRARGRKYVVGLARGRSRGQNGKLIRRARGSFHERWKGVPR